MTSRELVYDTLHFQNKTGRVPRQLWALPWARLNHPEALDRIYRDFEWDFDSPPNNLSQPVATRGDAYAVGDYTDEWGCVFHNIQAGVIGEVKEPLIREDDWSDVGNIHIPDELLTFDVDAVNRHCAETGKFVLSGCCPRPFERLQFIRGSAETYVDLMERPPRMMEFLGRMHDHNCRLLEKWAKTDVDALQFMDDWGSQNSLLINPALWVELFKPMYKDFADIAKAHGKKLFMHSDGNTIAIIPHLIEIGLDAMNTQIFCIGVENLAPFAGKLTFWGEIDRQHLLPFGSLKDIDAAVDSVYNTLWRDGGCIAQCEFGPMGRPENVRRVYERWDQK